LFAIFIIQDNKVQLQIWEVALVMLGIGTKSDQSVAKWTSDEKDTSLR
jgi:hypothetical protein